ncbi:MAG: hypothetical protein HZC24_09860 [Rhodocyclales bacterium]|nr:hypothetical protein [Rhodocyclales bacterium]
MNAALLGNIFQYWYVWIVGLLLAAIAAGFAARFVWPALRIGRELRQAGAALRALKARGGAAEPAAIARQAMASERLARLWAEYAETLHPQADAADAAAAPRWRATALAETFFTEQALVDSPLKTEFYKHLPGILTGLGIIGTFTGLIIGLVHFDVSLDPNQAQTQLRNLINAVGHAFLVSAVAITLAMLFTWIEKSLLTARYRQVEELRELVDGMFAVGADVEYLERLVVAAEASAAATAALKDELAAQWRAILAELAGNQQAATAQLQALFAAQTQESGELLRQTNAAMRTSAAQFAHMAERMDAAGRDAVAALGTRLGEQVVAVVGQLQDQARGAAAVQQQQSERLAQEAGAAVAGIAGQVERLIVCALDAGNAMQAAVAQLATTTGTAIAGMNAGAGTLAGAAGDFAAAGQGVATTLDHTAAALENINVASATLLAASGVTQKMLDGHGQAHVAFAALAADLKATVDTARREAALSAELVDRLQAAAAQLAGAERKSAAYLEQVNEVLIQSHQSFADNVERTLRESNRQFQKELSQAVSLLSGAIQDLGDTLDELPAKRAPS